MKFHPGPQRHADGPLRIRSLQLVLKALFEDLNAMERSPHLSLRIAAERLEPSASLNTLADQFAMAMKRAHPPNTASRSGRLPIETAPRDGGSVI